MRKGRRNPKFHLRRTGFLREQHEKSRGTGQSPNLERHVIPNAAGWLETPNTTTRRCSIVHEQTILNIDERA